MWDGDFEDALHDAVHDDHRIFGGFPTRAWLLMNAANDVGLHHAEATVVEPAQGDALEHESGVEGALEVVQEEAQTGEVVRILGFGVSEKNEVGFGLNPQAVEKVGNGGEGGQTHGVVRHARTGDAFGSAIDGVSLLRLLGQKGVGVSGDEDVEIRIFSRNDGLKIAVLVNRYVLERGKALGDKIDAFFFFAGRGGEFAEKKGVGEDKFLVGLEKIAEFGRGRHGS